MSRRPHVAILGAGPVGLEAALALGEKDQPFTLYEAGETVAANVRRWGHISLFSPWELNASPRARARLPSLSRLPENGTCPTGDELAETLLEPLAALPEIGPNLRLGSRVVAVGRQGLLKHEAIGAAERAGRPFRLLVRTASGEERLERADAVLDCTGSYEHPNATGDGGIPALGEEASGGAILRHIPDPASEPQRWSGRHILLVGAGYSAQTAARDLAALAEGDGGLRVTWALRRREPSFGLIDDDPLPERAALARCAAELTGGASPAIEARRGVVVERIERRDGRLAVTMRSADGDAAHEEIAVDRIVSLTGYVGDHRLYRQLQVHECYATCGPMKLAAALLGDATGGADCLAQESHGAETLKNPEPGFFILGSKSYGRNPTFLMRLGWQQVDEVVGLLAAR